MLVCWLILCLFIGIHKLYIKLTILIKQISSCTRLFGVSFGTKSFFWNLAFVNVEVDCDKKSISEVRMHTSVGYCQLLWMSCTLGMCMSSAVVRMQKIVPTWKPSPFIILSTLPHTSPFHWIQMWYSWNINEGTKFINILTCIHCVIINLAIPRLDFKCAYILVLAFLSW
jgi:hypothetical protein